MLILPDGWERWSSGHLDAVLTHEQEHLRRRDPLIQWFALLNRAILWFHPLAWWLTWRLSTLAEEACDAAVLRAGHSPQDYAGYLINMAHAVNRQGRRLNVAGMAMPGSGLPARIRHILEEGSMTPRSRTRALCTLAFCATSSIICAAVTLAPRPSATALSPTSGGAHAAPDVPDAKPTAPVLSDALSDERACARDRRAAPSGLQRARSRRAIAGHSAKFVRRLAARRIDRADPSWFWLTTCALHHLKPGTPSGCWPYFVTRLLPRPTSSGLSPHGALECFDGPVFPPIPGGSTTRFRRISTGRAVEPVPGSTSHSADSRRFAHATFLTATEVVRNLAKVEGRYKHFVFVSSGRNSGDGARSGGCGSRWGARPRRRRARIRGQARERDYSSSQYGRSCQCKRASTPEVIRVPVP